MLRVFGRLPDTGVSERTEAGVRKASGEETAGELSPAVVSAYGDLAPVFDLIGGLRTRAPAAPVARCLRLVAVGGDDDVAPSDLVGVGAEVAMGAAWPLPAGYRPGPGAVMRGGGKSVVVMSCRARAMGWARAEARSQVRKSR